MTAAAESCGADTRPDSETGPETRSARVSPAGAAIFLTGRDLEAAGVDPSTDEVAYQVESGGVTLEPVGEEETGG